MVEIFDVSPKTKRPHVTNVKTHFGFFRVRLAEDGVMSIQTQLQWIQDRVKDPQTSCLEQFFRRNKEQNGPSTQNKVFHNGDARSFLTSASKFNMVEFLTSA